MTNDTTIPTLPQIVSAMRYEIEQDALDGIVPMDVADFSALHDHVDANEYGPDLLGAGLTLDQTCDLFNMASDIIDGWLVGGGLTTPTDREMVMMVTP